MSEKPRIIVVGGGLAGLMATIKIAERGVPAPWQGAHER